MSAMSGSTSSMSVGPSSPMPEGPCAPSHSCSTNTCRAFHRASFRRQVSTAVHTLAPSRCATHATWTASARSSDGTMRITRARRSRSATGGRSSMRYGHGRGAIPTSGADFRADSPPRTQIVTPVDMVRPPLARTSSCGDRSDGTRAGARPSCPCGACTRPPCAGSRSRGRRSPPPAGGPAASAAPSQAQPRRPRSRWRSDSFTFTRFAGAATPSPNSSAPCIDAATADPTRQSHQ